MDLDIRFSEASQPLTLSSTYIGLDRYNNETNLFEIFCAIATTKCEAFKDAATQKTAPPPQNATSSTRQPSIASSRERTASVQAPSNANQSRTQGRRQSATPSNRPSRLRASLSLTAEIPQAPAPATQAQPVQEPLFQSGGSQSVRLTQEEALEMAGFTAEDLDLAMDDADLDEEAGGDREAADEAPSGWDEISFDVPAENMSTQRKDAERVMRDSVPRDSASVPPDPAHFSSDLADVTGGQFEPDDNIFGNDSDQNVKPEPVDNLDEELDADEIDATQDSGRKVSDKTQGKERRPTDAHHSSPRSSPTDDFHNCTVHYRRSTTACMPLSVGIFLWMPVCLMPSKPSAFASCKRPRRTGRARWVCARPQASACLRSGQSGTTDSDFDSASSQPRTFGRSPGQGLTGSPKALAAPANRYFGNAVSRPR